MDFDFKVPSVIPQDLLLIQDLIGTVSPLTLTTSSTRGVPEVLDSSDDSIASTSSEVESEDEVEADLAPLEEDSERSAAASDSGTQSDSDVDSGAADSEEEYVSGTPQQQRPADDVEDEDSGVASTSVYLQTKNEIVDSDIMIPTISAVGSCDVLEKVGEIVSIVGNIVIVRGLPVDNVKSLFGRALDAESLLVFEDRRVLGYIYETFGPTSQPLYQVKFNQNYPLDTDKVWLSREVFHVPQRSHFVFVDQLKKLRGSDASNIHDEEPADDELEFSDDEKEAAFRAQRKKRRGHSASSSRQSTPAPARAYPDDMDQGTYPGSNPYDACGPYDDDYHVTRSSRPPPVPYDDPYADIPASESRVPVTEMNEGGPNCESGERGAKASRGRNNRRGARGRGDRNRQPRNTSRREYRHSPITSSRTFNFDAHQSFPTTPQTEYATDYEHVAHAPAGPHSFDQPALDAWFSPSANNIQDYQQPFIQPHINPRFASAFGLNLPPQIMHMNPQASHNSHDHVSRQYQVNAWAAQPEGSEGDGDTYRLV